MILVSLLCDVWKRILSCSSQITYYVKMYVTSIFAFLNSKNLYEVLFYLVRN